MSETVIGPKCPNCGAPLELLPDHTCRWCHATVSQTPTGFLRRAELFSALSDSWSEGWKLAAAPGARHAIPWSMAEELLSPAKELMITLRAGLEQPGFRDLGKPHADKVETTEWCFCLLLNSLITAGLDEGDNDAATTYLDVCNLLDALADFDETDPQWTAAAHAAAAEARTRFGATWRADTEGDTPDPFLTELHEWIDKQLRHAGKHHFWQ